MYTPKLWVLAGLLGLAAACTCPPTPCTTFATVTLHVPTWQVGTYVLDLTVGPAVLACRFDVITEGVGPLLWDKACGDTVAYADFVLDTGGTTDPHLLEVRTPVGPDAHPATARLTLTHEAAAGAAVLVDETVDLSWRDRNPSGSACQEGCGTADIVAEVPAR